MHYYFPDNCPDAFIKGGVLDIPTDCVDPIGANAIGRVKDWLRSNNLDSNDRYTRTTADADVQTHVDSYDILVQLFTNSYPTDAPVNTFGAASGEKTYAVYKSYLVYQDTTSTDVIGFVLVRAPKEVNKFD